MSGTRHITPLTPRWEVLSSPYQQSKPNPNPKADSNPSPTYPSNP